MGQGKTAHAELTLGVNGNQGSGNCQQGNHLHKQPNDFQDATWTPTGKDVMIWIWNLGAGMRPMPLSTVEPHGESARTCSQPRESCRCSTNDSAADCCRALVWSWVHSRRNKRCIFEPISRMLQSPKPKYPGSTERRTREPASCSCILGNDTQDDEGPMPSLGRRLRAPWMHL